MTPPTIAAVHAREILDSRGRPTVQADVTLGGGAFGRASVPSGASTGRHEKHERRDGGTRYGGLGVRDAVAAVNGPLGDALLGMVANQAEVDRAMVDADGTEERSRYGANAILAISLALLRALAAHSGLPVYRYLAGSAEPVLPRPMINLLSGGRHARHAMDIQDVLVVPVGATTFAQGLEWACDVHRATEAVLDARGWLPSGLADEGGYGVPISTEQALAVTVEAIEKSGRTAGAEVAIALDIAASQLYDTVAGRYVVDGTAIDASALVERIADWTRRYPIVSIEDPLHEDDWDGWHHATRVLGHLQLIGDDLFTTNTERLQHGIETGAANAVLVKPNQIGTLSETRGVVDQAHAAGYRAVVSARSGETEDDILADLAVGLAVGQIKIGSVTGSERLAKYNRLLQISEELGSAGRLGRDG